LPQLGQSKLLHYAAVLIAGGKLDGADQVVRTLQLAKLTPDGQLALMQTKADLLAARQNWVDARAELERLIKLAPMNGRALLSLGRTYAAEENWPRATLVFETAYRIPSATYRASLELANIELKNRHYDRSIEYLEKALSLHKTDGIEDYLARVRTLAASRG
jgi:tetratricopeptide (TPR) repeat protein